MADAEPVGEAAARGHFASRQRPFIGLRPFTYEDAEYYFGREEQIDALETLLLNGSLIAVIGSSGSGKSSLVRAGLLHRIMTDATPAAPAWERVEMRPGEAPIRNLAEALARHSQSAGERGYDPLAEAHADRIEQQLHGSSFGIRDSLALLNDRGGRQLVILVDQFEEIFRFADLRERRVVDPRLAAEQRDEATQFIQLLLTATDDPGFPAKIIITMRSDFIGECARFHGLSEAVTRSQYLVPALTRDQRAIAIRGPVEKAGGTIEPALVQRLLNQTDEDLDQLPILQHAMMRCWQYATMRPGAPHLTLVEDYAAIGGIDHALTQHANEILEELEHDDRADAGPLALGNVTRRLFQCLTDTDAQGRTIRRPQTIGDLTSVLVRDDAAEGDIATAADALHQVVARFSDPDCSFLRSASLEHLLDDTVIDIGHEALIRRWIRLGGLDENSWVREEREDAQKYRDLVAQADFGGTIEEEPLRIYQDWWARRQPNRAWARRYSRGGVDRFDTARSVLARSEARIGQQHEEMRRAEAAARRTRRGIIAAVILFIALLGGGGSYISLQQAENARRDALRQQENAQRAADTAEREQSKLVAMLGMQALRLSNPHAALAIVSKHLEKFGPGQRSVSEGSDVPELYLLAYAALQQLREKSIIRVGTSFMALAFDADDHLMTFLGGNLRILDRAKMVAGGNESPDVIKPINLPRLPYANNIARSEDGTVALVSNSVQTYIIDLLPGTAHEPPELIRGGGGIMSRDGKLILTTTRGDRPRLWRCGRDRRGGRIACPEIEEFEPQDDNGPIRDAPAVAISPDDKYLALANPDGEISIFQTSDFKLIKKIAGSGQVLMLTFNPQNPALLLGTYVSASPRLLYWRDNRAVTLNGGANAFRATFSPDGTLIAAPSLVNRVIDVWRTADGWRTERGRDRIDPQISNRSEETFYQVAFNKQNELVGGSSTGNVWLWDLLAVGMAHDLPGGAAAQTEVKGETISVSQAGTTVSLLPASNQYRMQSSLRGLTGPIRTPRNSWDAEPAGYRGSTGSGTPDDNWRADHIALSPDGNWLAITPKMGSILLYDLRRADRDNPRQTDGRPVGAFGASNATWQTPAVFIDDPQPLLMATPQRGVPAAWYYFAKGSDLAEFGRKSLPLDIDLTGPTMRVCQFAMPAEVRAELNGNFLPAIGEITKTREALATDSTQPNAGPRLAEPNRASCGSPT